MPTNCNWAFRVPCKGNDFIPVFFHVKVQYFSSAFYRGGFLTFGHQYLFRPNDYIITPFKVPYQTNACHTSCYLLLDSTSDIPISADSKYIHLCQINEKLLCLVSWIKIAQAQKNIYTFTTTNTINLAIWILIHKT